MTSSTPPSSPPFEDQATAIADPHESKFDPNDPRLRIAHSAGRTLKRGPVIAAISTLVAGSVGATATALHSPDAPKAASAETEPAAAPQPPNLPEALRDPDGVSSGAPAAPPLALQTAPAFDAGPAGAYPPPGYGAPDRRTQIRQEEDEKALAAPVLFEAHGGAPAATPDTATTTPLAARTPGAAPASSAAAEDDPNRQQRKTSFLESQGPSEALETAVQHPSSPYEIQAGTIIPAVLITAINSDLPGPVIAQVRENVFDTVTGNTLLVPQGARLLADYDSMVSWGQSRVLLCWRRLLFPNGDSINLHCAPAADLQGAAGLTDKVDEHWLRLIAAVGITSVLAATTQFAAGNQTGFAPTVPQMLASNTAQSVNQSGQQIVRRDLQVQPTITVRPGFSVNVIVHQDLALPPYPPAEGLASTGGLLPASP